MNNFDSENLGKTIIVGLVSSAILGSVISYFNSRKNGPLPPGPPGLPLIGNAHQIGGKNMITVLDGWSKQYGPLFHFRLFGTPVIVVNSSKIAKELMDERGKNYSGRPNFILASDAMQGGMMMPFIHANDRFRRVRKMVTNELRPSAVKEFFHPIQTIEVHRLVYCMATDPQNWSTYIGRAIASILMTVVYDKPLRSGEDSEEAIKNVIRLNDELISALDGGKNYVDFLPWLRFIPKAPYKAPAAAYHKLAEKTYRGLMDSARMNLESGKPAKGIAARLIESQFEVEADYREQYWGLASFFLAGSDTQSIASHSLILALALHPHVLRKAQEEVDRVVGSQRCPDFTDEVKLPYIKAMVKEVLRWRPTGPTAIPHASIEDDMYNGFFIPGGSMIIPNIWSMNHDSTVFDRPDQFDPDRYFNDPDLPLHSFGFGRRACPGQRVGEHTLLLEFATMVWALDIKQATDPKTGELIPLDSDRETGFSPVGLLRAHPFQVDISTRFPDRIAILDRLVKEEGL